MSYDGYDDDFPGPECTILYPHVVAQRQREQCAAAALARANKGKANDEGKKDPPEDANPRMSSPSSFEGDTNLEGSDSGDTATTNPARKLLLEKEASPSKTLEDKTASVLTPEDKTASVPTDTPSTVTKSTPESDDSGWFNKTEKRKLHDRKLPEVELEERKRLEKKIKIGTLVSKRLTKYGLDGNPDIVVHDVPTLGLVKRLKNCTGRYRIHFDNGMRLNLKSHQFKYLTNFPKRQVLARDEEGDMTVKSARAAIVDKGLDSDDSVEVVGVKASPRKMPATTVARKKAVPPEITVTTTDDVEDDEVKFVAVVRSRIIKKREEKEAKLKEGKTKEVKEEKVKDEKVKENKEEKAKSKEFVAAVRSRINKKREEKKARLEEGKTEEAREEKNKKEEEKTSSDEDTKPKAKR